MLLEGSTHSCKFAPVVSFAEPVQLAGRNVSFRIALRAKAEVLCGKNTMIRKGLQIGHNDSPNVGLDKSRAYMKGNLDFISATKCSLDDIREVLANNRRWQGVRTGQISNVDLVSPSGPTSMVHRRPVSSSCFALEKDGWSRRLRDCVGSRQGCSRGLSVILHFLSHLSGGGHIPSYIRYQCVHVEPHRWCCPGQPSSFQRYCLGLRRTDRGPLVFLTSVPRVMFPAKLCSTLQKGAWHGPTVAK